MIFVLRFACFCDHKNIVTDQILDRLLMPLLGFMSGKRSGDRACP